MALIVMFLKSGATPITQTVGPGQCPFFHFGGTDESANIPDNVHIVFIFDKSGLCD
jgi:hypothetical protein